VRPFDRSGCPGALETAGDRVVGHSAAMAALPAETLLRDVRAFGLGANLRRVAGAMALAERVPASRQGDGLLVVHRHVVEGLADFASGCERVRAAARTFRIDVDQPHLNGREGVLERLAGVMA